MLGDKILSFQHDASPVVLYTSLYQTTLLEYCRMPLAPAALTFFVDRVINSAPIAAIKGFTNEEHARCSFGRLQFENGFAGPRSRNELASRTHNHRRPAGYLRILLALHFCRAQSLGIECVELADNRYQLIVSKTRDTRTWR